LGWLKSNDLGAMLVENHNQTALYGQGRVSLALWCCAGLVFSKTWVKNQAGLVINGYQLSAQFPWPPTATGT
jgi:hypothetical protein